MAELIGYKRVSTPKDFRRWFDYASPGTTCVYYVGDLAYDRIGHSDRARAVDELGAMAWEYARSLDVHLLQKKIAFNEYEYRAVKTNPKNTARLNKLADRLRQPLSAHELGAISTRDIKTAQREKAGAYDRTEV